MKSSSSKILKLGGIIGLGIFGLAGLIYWKRSIKNVSEVKGTEEGNAQKSEADPETTKESNHGDIQPASARTKTKTEFNSPEELIENTLRTVLKENEFRSSDEFLEHFISRASTLCDDYSWFDYFPKSSNELREVLDKYGFLKQFDVQLYNKFMKK